MKKPIEDEEEQFYEEESLDDNEFCGVDEDDE